MMEEKNKKGVGSFVGILIILVTMLVGGIYFSREKIQTAREKTIPAPQDDSNLASIRESLEAFSKASSSTSPY